MQVIYLMSPVRSGSTFLQFLLSGHPEIVGLGEIASVIRFLHGQAKKHKQLGQCSCGEQANECVFWGGLLDQLKGMGSEVGFEAVLNHFQALYPGKLLLDSSKDDVVIKDLYLKTHIVDKQDIKVLFLVRDFRGWSASLKKHSQSHQMNSIWQTNLIILSYRWFYTTLRRHSWLKQQGIPFLWVHYENLVFDTDRQLQRIYRFLELPMPDQIKMAPKESHELFGSWIKGDPVMSQQIVYDRKWMSDMHFTVFGPLIIAPAYLNMLSATKRSSE